MAKKFDIKKYLKEGQDPVIDIDDVEYLVKDDAVSVIESGEQEIPLKQLFDGQIYFLNIDKIKNSLLEKGAIDYIDKK